MMTKPWIKPTAFLFTVALTLEGAAHAASVTPRLRAADMNGDGYSELIYLPESGQGIVLFFNQRSERYTFSSEGASLADVQAGDINSDSRPDLILLHSREGGVQVLWGATFNPATAGLLTGAGAEAASLDVSGSKAAIGFTGGPGAVIVSAEREKNSLISSTIKTSAPVRDVAWGDLNQDGVDELVLLLDNLEIQVLQPAPVAGDPLAMKTWASTPISDTAMDHVAVGLFNTDAIEDILLWSDISKPVVLTSDGAGQFTATTIEAPVLDRLQAIDITKDGILDFLGIAKSKDQLFLLRNDGRLNLKLSSLALENQTIIDFSIGYFTQMAELEVVIWSEDANGKENLTIYNGLSDGALRKVTDLEVPEEDPADALQGFANVLIYKARALELGDPFVYRSFRADHWSTGASLSNEKLLVQREQLVNGLLQPGSETTYTNLGLSEDASEYTVQVNQSESGRSFYSFSKPQLPSALNVRVSPPGGSYAGTIISQATTEDGTNLYFRINMGSWIKASSTRQHEIIVASQTRLDFYADTGRGVYSPMETVEYTIDQPASADSDFDGIPDLVEIQLGLPVFSSDFDADRDGWNDLDELLRYSDPLVAPSVPSDQDTPAKIDPAQPEPGDGWSDFDENARFTDPNDPDSAPVAPGIQVGEYQLAVQPDSRYYNTVREVTVEQNLFVFGLNGTEESRTAQANHTWTTRLPGDRPFYLRGNLAESSQAVLLSYSPSFIPYWNPASYYTDSETVTDWLNAVRNYTLSAFYTQRQETLSATTTAVVLAFNHWLANELRLSQAIHVGDTDRMPTLEQLNVLREKYDLDQVYEYFSASLPEDHAWVQLVQKAIEESRTTPPASLLDRKLASLLWGEEEDDELQAAMAEAQTAIASLFSQVPTLNMKLDGTVVLEENALHLRATNGTTYRLDAGSADIRPNSTLSVLAKLESSDDGDRPIAGVKKILSYSAALALNTQDSDSDGLPDQWEKYYFGRTDAQPGEDSDQDGYTNLSELLAYSHPLNGMSKPSGPVPTPTPPGTGVREWYGIMR